MKAKVLVEKLNEFIKTHGEDILVYVYDHEYGEDFQMDEIGFIEAEVNAKGFGSIRHPNRLTIRG